ncbi:hypothetical protein Tco_1140698 [Tanacetum coccineum]
MDCTTPADACGLNVDIKTTLVQQSGVPPTEETSVIVVVRREFTPSFEEGVRDQNIGVSRNVRGCLLPCFSVAAASANRFPPTVEPRIQTVAAVDARNTADRNCVPISRVFDRFRNMRATSDHAEYTSQTVVLLPLSITGIVVQFTQLLCPYLMFLKLHRQGLLAITQRRTQSTQVMY